ncbi:MAG: 2-C-methyl-D-erythritol 4-phosphate cytidylyltransferase [Eubacteriales bacterium]|nr:2-C-methyl-D-erythritol 4-phosphate cytidylyltransferase [Eubacteriales bacterium]
MERKRATAILLAGGSGTRMGGSVRKQYMELGGKPVLRYALEALERSPVISEIVLVVPEGEQDYCRREIVEPAEEACRAAQSGGKVRAIIPGGAERCFSVLNGLRAIQWPCEVCYIHDGARPFLDGETLERLARAVADGGTAVAGMPAKDTVKLADADGIVESTPNREAVWIVQTPQVFERALITEAYERMAEQYDALRAAGVNITDDAMVVERLMNRSVRLVPASYRNIKITTPEDLLIAEAFLRG